MNFPIPEKTRKQNLDLYPFQKTILQQMLNSPSKKLMVAPEMGLGKTPISFVFPNVLGLSRILVTCTASARLNIAREADRWFNQGRKGQFATAILSSKDLRYIMKRGMFKNNYHPTPFIVSYDMLVSSKPLRDYIASRKWDLCISDEFQECKTYSAQRTIATMFLWSNIEYCLFLSGTPLTNSAADLFPTLNAIVGQPELKKFFTKEERSLCQTFDNFTQKFTYVRNTPYGIQYVGIRNRDILKAILKNKKANFYFRVLKKDVLKDLPDKTFNRVDLNLDVKTSLDPKFLARFLNSFKQDNENLKTLADSKAMGTLRRELGEAIITCKDAHEFTKQFLDYGKPIVIFAWHKSVISFLTHHFRRYNPVVHDGSKTPREKQKAVDDFQNGHTNLFIGNIKSAGVAITLTRAADCIFYEIDWLPHIIAQAIDRCIGEGQPVLTPTGWRPIETIQIGDKVITRNGESSRVVDAWSKGSLKMMAEVTVEGWQQPIVTTDDHRFLLADGTWKEAGQLYPGDRIAMPVPNINFEEIAAVPFDKDCKVTKHFFNNWGVKQKKARLLKTPDEIELTDKTLFVLGYYVGDGFSSTTKGKGQFISFSGNIDKKAESVKRCKKWLESFGIPSTIYAHSNGGRGVELRGYSLEWANWFRKQFGHGARNKHLPEWALSMNKRQSKMFLKGMLASDGYIRKGRYEYATSSGTLAAQTALLMLRSGYRPCATRQSPPGSCHVIAYSDNSISQDALVRSVTLRYPKKINGRREQVYDLTVENGESFVVGLSVVHNCHRIGQKNAVTAHFFITKNEFHKHFMQTMIRKQRAIDKVI